MDRAQHFAGPGLMMMRERDVGLYLMFIWTATGAHTVAKTLQLPRSVILNCRQWTSM